MDVREVLDAAKAASNSESDAALAKRIGVTRASVSNWRVGRNYPDTVVCAKLAEITGIPLARVLGIVGEARAISREEKAVWRRLATAAIVLIATLPGISFAHHTAQLNHGKIYALCEIKDARLSGAGSP